MLELSYRFQTLLPDFYKDLESVATLFLLHIDFYVMLFIWELLMNFDWLIN